MKQLHCVEIVETKPHPESNKLKICLVSDGEQSTQVITSAKNARIGVKTILAPVGSRMENGMEIVCNGLKGIPSNGVLCTELDLGISDEKNLVELDNKIALGITLSEIDREKLSCTKWEKYQELEVYWFNLLTDEIFVERKGQLGAVIPSTEQHWVIIAKTYFFEGKYFYREFKIDLSEN